MPRKDVLRSAMTPFMAVLLFTGLAGLPQAVRADARKATIVLEWTAPGDDGYQGDASQYDLRVSLAPITNENFDRAAPVPHVSKPGKPGSRDRAVINQLTPETTYYFALKTADECGNWSLISNVARVYARHALTTQDLPQALGLALPYPNPARTGASFEAALPRDASIHMEVFDPSGRRVKTLAYGEYPAGRNVFRWDLRGTNGERLEDGLYWVRLRSRDDVVTRRLLIAR